MMRLMPLVSSSSSPDGLPTLPGTYALLLRLDPEADIQVGKLGRFHFPRGWYVYVGSARGAGGLAARVRHHWGSAMPAHWHIDFLRRLARPIDIWWEIGSARRECEWAGTIGRSEGALLIAPGFGATDCSCISHLWYFRLRPDAMIEPILPSA